MRRGFRRLAVGGLATGLALALLGVPAAIHEAQADTPPDLTLTTSARYDVQPAARLVRVSVAVTATNHRSDTVTRRFFFDHAFLAIQPGTTHLGLSATGATPHVRVAKRTSAYTVLQLDFGRKVYSGTSLGLKLTFDIRDPGGAPNRDVRIGESLATFPVWAFASNATPGSSVSVSLPAGYAVRVQGGPLDGPSAGPNGTIVYSAGPLAKPLAFFAYLSADRPGAFRETDVSASVEGVAVPIVVRAWTDDPSFGDRISKLAVRALPAESALIGLAYPGPGPVVIAEAVSRATGGYAGLYDPTASSIEVAYYASPLVVLHETAHSWFNGYLLTDRWADEAFASYYAQLAAAQLKIKDTSPVLTQPLLSARIPLNDWAAIGRADASEPYGYAASLALAQLIAKRAGADGLTAVWRAAAKVESAYQPAHPLATPETVPTDASGVPPRPDWRGLLDLLEERTGATYDDLWRAWVVTPDQAPLLDRRAHARAAYADAVRAAGDWELPPVIRRAMAAWQFDQAEALMARARAVLAQRPALEDRAKAAGLILPATLKTAFQGDGGPPAAEREVAMEQAALGRIEQAQALGASEPDLVSRVGLLGADPAADIHRAAAAFAAGDLLAASSAADAAAVTVANAYGNGRGRLALTGLVVALAGLVILLASRRRTVSASRRRRSRRTYR